MATIDQVRVGLAAYFDSEIKPTLPQMKGILYGTAVGLALAKPERLLAKIMPAAQMLGVMDETGQIDVDALATEIKRQMAGNGGEIRMGLALNPMNPADRDTFRFTASDVDKLTDMIRRA